MKPAHRTSINRANRVIQEVLLNVLRKIFLLILNLRFEWYLILLIDQFTPLDPLVKGVLKYLMCPSFTCAAQPQSRITG